MLAIYFVGIILIAGICPINASLSSCQSPDPYLSNDVITAMTWNAVGRPCTDTIEAKLRNETSEEFLAKAKPEQQASMEKTSERFLSRKRRFYIAKDPIVTCELRYFVPLFSISTELASFFTLEFPSGVDFAYPILENNPATGKGDAALQASDIFDGISNLISKLGVDGRTCVLRAICDVAAITPIKPQGIIRDAMEIAISHMLKEARNGPGESNETSSESNISYMDAVAVGKSGLDCATEFKNCPFTFLSIVNLSNV